MPVIPELEPAPRQIPLQAFSNALLGGFINQVGWALLAFSLIFVWLFTFDFLVEQWRFSGRLERGEALIEAVAPASARENKVQVYEYRFSFDYRARHWRASSYFTGHRGETGETVPIEFKPEHPDIARITLPGFRSSLFGGGALLILIFPFCSLLLIVPGFFKGVRVLRLLRQGELTRAALSEQRPTGSTVIINQQRYPVYDLFFQFQVQGSAHTVRIRTHEIERLRDEPAELFLYLPARPELAFPLDAIPGHCSVEGGRIVFYQPEKSLLYLLLPALALFLASLMLIGMR
jgi:hypothetical protein